MRRCGGTLRRRPKPTARKAGAARRAAFSIAAGGTKTVRVVVSRRALRLVERRRGVRARRRAHAAAIRRAADDGPAHRHPARPRRQAVHRRRAALTSSTPAPLEPQIVPGAPRCR